MVWIYFLCLQMRPPPHHHGYFTYVQYIRTEFTQQSRSCTYYVWTEDTDYIFVSLGGGLSLMCRYAFISRVADYLVPHDLLRRAVQGHPAGHSSASASSLGALEVWYATQPLPLVSDLRELVPVMKANCIAYVKVNIFNYGYMILTVWCEVTVWFVPTVLS
jgi:hypothetical protein